jgi:hypothetical protein
VKEGRKCGTCVECCTALAVPELEKAVGERCRHLVAPGKCGVYDSRPPSCRDYACGWLMGGLSSSERPDRVGFIVEAHPVDGAKEPSVVIRETREGSSRRDRAMALIRKLEGSRVIFVIPTEGERRILGPVHLVSRVVAAAGDLLARGKP